MNIGGQAVIEGVMMRNKEKLSIAVRLPSGKIKLKKEKSSQFPKFFDFFFFRGVVGLGYTLYDGIKALSWSSEQQLGKKEKLTKMEFAGTILVSLIFAVLLFVVLPFFSAWLIHPEGFWFNFLDGLIRMTVFLAYLAVISRIKEVQILFQYHGAEHQVISCHEAGKELTVSNARQFSRFHPRCGTSFLFLIILLSIIIFSFVSGSLWQKLAGRILLLPVIAGIGYEAIRLSGKHRNRLLVRAAIAPGLWLQRITTKKPNGRQLEVGIAALKGVLE